jgi:HTH-type transcriptional regulator/antitoxin HigA
MITEALHFKPDWASPPGATIVDILEERNLKPSEFAQRLGYTSESVDALLEGRVEITIKVAQELVKVLGASTAFWMTREAQYRQDLARIRPDETCRADAAWLTELPLKEMRRFGWLSPHTSSGDELKACLQFFGVPDVSNWRETYQRVFSTSAFRTSPSFCSEFGATAAWLRQGELEAESINTKPWNAERFQVVLQKIRSLTRKKDPGHFIPELQKVCAEAGVAVVVLRAPAGCRASGATRFLSRAKACILLSFRHLSDDHFWFTFFHEAGHLLLHKKNALFLEGTGVSSPSEEKEANEFAARTLIPAEFHSHFESLRCSSKDVIKFALAIGVSPGIIVGQMQHYGLLSRRHLNGLKRRFVWAGD